MWYFTLILTFIIMEEDSHYQHILDSVDPDVNHYGDYDVNFLPCDIDTLKNNVKLDDGFNILHHNSRSLLAGGKLENYGVLLETNENPFHVIGLTETWLRPDNANTIDLEGYEHIYAVRSEINDSKNWGGGLSFFIKSGLNYKICNHLTNADKFLETLFLEVSTSSKTYLLGLIYRIPNTNSKIFIEKLNNIIEPIKGGQKMILLGDFNIDLLQENAHTREFQNMLQCNYLIPTILEATRVASVNRNGENHVTETLIDNIFVGSDIVFKSGLIYSSISDHYPIYVSILDNDFSSNPDFINTVKIRVIDDFKVRKFKSALQRSFFHALQDIKQAKSAFSCYFSILNSLYNKYFPIVTKQVKVKSLLKPWVTDVIIKRIKIRDKLGKRAKMGKIEREIFTRFRNKLTFQLKLAKSKYFHTEFDKHKGNGRKTWELINTNLRPNTNSNIISLKEGDHTINKKCVSNKFLDYFTNSILKLKNNIPPSSKSVSIYLKNNKLKTFLMLPILKEEVETAISQLNASSPLYSISCAVLESVKTIISPYLAEIFNLCINEGYFPEEIKLGCITPIFKKGSRNITSNYRPVCSISPFSKIIEKIVHNRMSDFLEKFSLLTNSQYGFRKGMGTDNALIEFTDYIHKGLTNKNSVGTVFMDLSKAFDLMDHKILKVKLEHYGFRGNFLDFIMSFLQDRKVFVHANGHSSNIETVNIGVPQGSTLGPLLFLLFVNDMEYCSNLLKFIQFADDTTVMFSSPDIDHLNEILEAECNKVIEWFNTNELIINLSKTNCMLFTNKKCPISINIMLSDYSLDLVSETTFLGIVIDNKLSWKAHIKLICNKISKSIAILRLLKQSFPKKVLRTIYMALIFSHINYCNLVWGGACKSVLEPLVKLQKRAIRIINKSAYLAHTDPIFKTLNILPLHEVFILNCLLFMYKCINLGKYPVFFLRLNKYSETHNHNTRGNNLLKPPRSRLEICKNSFFVKGINTWNMIDIRIKLSKSIYIFKKRIKCALIDKTLIV